MSNNIKKRLESVEELMDVYADYEGSKDNPEDSVDILQNLAYSNNPITPVHLKYYHSKYKKGHYWIILILILSIILYTIHFTGMYLFLNLLGVDIFKNFLNRIVGITLFSVLFNILAIFVGKNTHKWNWKKYTIMLALVLGE